MTKLPSLSAIGSCLLLILCMTACSGAGVRASLDRIESYISDNPGKAIEDLDSLGGKNIYGKKNRAHYALLYSMALDKSQIHTTDTSINRFLWIRSSTLACSRPNDTRTERQGM